MVVEMLDRATCCTNHYPVDKHSKNRLLYPLYRHLSVDSVMRLSNDGLRSKHENFASLTIDNEQTVASIIIMLF